VQPFWGLGRLEALAKAPPIRPQPWQEEAVRSAFALARQHLSLPSRVTFSWRAGGPGGVAGVTNLAADGTIRVYLNAQAPPGAATWTWKTALHELAHVSDYFTGAYRGMTHEEMESRARRFAAEMEERPLLEERRDQPDEAPFSHPWGYRRYGSGL